MRSIYTLRKRCLPIFHSTSTTSSPSERATRSAASRIFSNCNERLPGQGRSNAHYNRQTQKSGLAPTRSCDPLRAKPKYMPRVGQKQGKCGEQGGRREEARECFAADSATTGTG